MGLTTHFFNMHTGSNNLFLHLRPPRFTGLPITAKYPKYIYGDGNKVQMERVDDGIMRE
jgi:hypothetical protein